MAYPALDLRFAPGPGAGTLQDMLYVELDPFERAVRDPIEEPPHSGSCPRRRALRPRVRDAGLREPLPHALVVRGHFVDRDGLGHAEIVAA